MPIGEFGGAPPLVAEGSPALTTPMYWMYEMAHASLNPARAVTDATKILFQNIQYIGVVSAGLPSATRGGAPPNSPIGI